MVLTEKVRRVYAPGVNQVDNQLPVKAATSIFAGMALEWDAGYLIPLSGTGDFAGFALEDSVLVAGESSGDRVIQVRQAGAIELTIATDTLNANDLGDSALSIEATDDDTFRLETGAAIAGTLIGYIMRIVDVGGAGTGVVLTSFKAFGIA